MTATHPQKSFTRSKSNKYPDFTISLIEKCLCSVFNCNDIFNPIDLCGILTILLSNQCIRILCSTLQCLFFFLPTDAFIFHHTRSGTMGCEQCIFYLMCMHCTRWHALRISVAPRHIQLNID